MAPGNQNMRAAYQKVQAGIQALIDGQHFITWNTENALNISFSQQKHELDKNVSPFAEAHVHYWDLNFVIKFQGKTLSPFWFNNEGVNNSRFYSQA